MLGGTAWLGREIVRAARAQGHEVTVLARGAAGPPPEGASFVAADRNSPTAYDAVRGRDWDAVVDVSRQPSQVRSAVAALGGRSAHWAFVSSCSVYAAHDTPGADETAALLPAHPGDDEGWQTYGGRKVACEQAVLDGIPGRALVARSGLIAGPGDPTDRTGYWPLRFARPAAADGTVLVPDSPLSTQVLDVRDLASWLVAAAAAGAAGVVNAGGPTVSLRDHLDTARTVAGHRGPVLPVSPGWLRAQGVEPWSGPRSLPLWLPLPEFAGFMDRSSAPARLLGLRCRPLARTLEDTLSWELRRGPDHDRGAGLSPSEERELQRLARDEGPEDFGPLT